MDIKIAPSILASDFSKLGEEVKDVSDAGADYIHIDVMDGHFVPNLTIGFDVIASIRAHSDKVFDTHLMIEPVEPFIERFAEAGSDIITIQAEATKHLHQTCSQIANTGKKVGVAINPATPISSIQHVLEVVDLVLIMTVNPGYGGQKFLPLCLPKIQQTKNMIEKSGKNIDLEVDGGINPDTAKQAVDAGANVLVAGSAVFKGTPEEYKINIDKLRM